MLNQSIHAVFEGIAPVCVAFNAAKHKFPSAISSAILEHKCVDLSFQIENKKTRKVLSSAHQQLSPTHCFECYLFSK